MASVLFVLNDGPYGSERSYNALRHAMAVAKQDDTEVKLFLTADATACAIAGQSPPEGILLYRAHAQGAYREEGARRPMRHLHGRPWLGVGAFDRGHGEGIDGSPGAVDNGGRQGARLLMAAGVGRRAPVGGRIDPTILELHARVCKTMAYPIRLALLNALRDGERGVGDLAEAIEASQPLVSQHLAVLRNQGVLRNRRNGSEVFYSIAYPKMIQACDLLREVLFEHLRFQEELLTVNHKQGE